MNEEEYEMFEEEMIRFTDELPAFFREFQKDALKVSHLNGVPAVISLFVMLGQISKDFVRIPNGANVEDTRIHFGWIQTSGTGKSTLWNFVGPIANDVHKRINEESNHPVLDKFDHVVPSTFNIFSLTDYTDPTLIGGFNKTMDDDGEIEWVRIPGHLEGNGLAHWDEFEYSGVFKQTQHNESSIVYLNTLMNTLAGESWVISKALRQFDNQIMYCFSQRSVIAMTYPPENLSDVIANKGVLQRMLLYVHDVPEYMQRKMRKEQIKHAGQIVESNAPIERYVNGIYTIYKVLEERYHMRGNNPLNTMTYSDGYREALEAQLEAMEEFINNTNGEVRKVAQNFTTRLMKILQKMSVICSIAQAPSIKNHNERFIVTPQNVRQAASIVRQCYSTLVDWLEQGLRVKRKSIAEKSLFPLFVKCYGEMEKDEEGFVPKNELLNTVMKEGKKSKASIYNYFKKIEHKFKTDKQGRSVYVKLVGDEE